MRARVRLVAFVLLAAGLLGLLLMVLTGMATGQAGGGGGQADPADGGAFHDGESAGQHGQDGGFPTGVPVEVLHSGNGFALRGNDSFLLRLKVESLLPLKASQIQSLLQSNKSLEEIRVESVEQYETVHTCPTACSTSVPGSVARFSPCGTGHRDVIRLVARSIHARFFSTIAGTCFSLWSRGNTTTSSPDDSTLSQTCRARLLRRTEYSIARVVNSGHPGASPGGRILSRALTL